MPGAMIAAPSPRMPSGGAAGAALSVPQLDGTGAAPRRCDERPAHRDRTQRAADADGPAIAPAQRHAAHLCRALAARKRTTWREDDRAVPPRVDAVQAEPDIAARRLRARSCIPDRELFSGGSTAAAGRPHKREVRVAARVEHPPVCQRECTRAPGATSDRVVGASSQRKTGPARSSRKAHPPAWLTRRRSR